LAQLSSSSASAFTIFRGDTPDSLAKIETDPAATERRSDHGQCLASHGKRAWRKTAGEQLERIHVDQAIRLDLHRRKSVPEKGRSKKRPSVVNFRLVAVQELRGDAGNMNMQLVLAAARAFSDQIALYPAAAK
jgi:hypothetical protein